MHITLSQKQFVDYFKNSNYRDRFSKEALEVIYDYYDNEDKELDFAGICCEWTEYTSLEKACASYDIDCEGLDFYEVCMEFEGEAFLLKNDNILVQSWLESTPN